MWNMIRSAKLKSKKQSKRGKNKRKSSTPWGHFLPPMIFVASLDWHPHASVTALARACFWFSDFFVIFWGGL
jgi:hypothetical protein